MATNVYHLYLSRFVCGFVGGGTMLVIPVYVSEIADDKYTTVLMELYLVCIITIILIIDETCIFWIALKGSWHIGFDADFDI